MLRNLSPDDVIVVSADRPVSQEQAEKIKTVLRTEFRHPAQRVLVLDGGCSLDVLPVRPGAAPLSAELVATEDAAGVAALRAEVADVWRRLDAVLDEVCTTDAAVDVLRAQIKQLAARA